MSKDTLKRTNKSKRKKVTKPEKLPKHLEHINKMAAGIDVGSASHFVAVPEGFAEQSVREFKSFTSDLYALAEWLKACGIETIAMESTGVYWIPLYELLESQGFEVRLVDARHVKNVSGRKTDVMDCQWLQQLHTYGLLNGAFRPEEKICVLRSYLRHRHMLVEQAAQHIQHMQKALSQMNIQLQNVIGDITGNTGMKIIREIVAGERDRKVLASYRDRRCKNSVEVIEKSLEGCYRDEHIFALNQALELYDIYHQKLGVCDKKIEEQLSTFEEKAEIEKEAFNLRSEKRRTSDKNTPLFNLNAYLRRMTGVDLTAIPGIEAYTSLKIISEIGLDMNRWKTGKQFASWLGLCPGNKVSGGKILSSKSKRTASRAASALRMAASTLHRSQSALGAFLRRMKSRLGSPKAITATAHKLAIIIYNMLKHGAEYVDIGQDYYEKSYQERLVKGLEQRAKTLGFQLVKIIDPLKSLGEVI